VGGGVLGLNADGLFGAEVGALVVFVVHVELRDVEVFVDAFVVALYSFWLGESAMDGGAFGGTGRIAVGGGVSGGSGVGVGGERRWESPLLELLELLLESSPGSLGGGLGGNGLLGGGVGGSGGPGSW